MQPKSIGISDALEADKAGVSSLTGEVDVLRGKRAYAALSMSYRGLHDWRHCYNCQWLSSSLAGQVAWTSSTPRHDII